MNPARRSSLFVLTWLLGLRVSTAGQSPPACLNETSGPAARTSAPREPPELRMSWKLLAPNVLHDQKRVWLFPASLAHGKQGVPGAALVLATAGLVALDPHNDPYFRRSQTFNQFNRTPSSANTIVEMALAPLSTYAWGLARRNSYAQQTAELATEAVLDAEIPALVLRDVSRRVRPRDIPANGDFSDTWFRRK